MYTRIFVPLDGSQRAEQALPVAARIARNTGGTLVLARVVSIASELNRCVVLPPAGPPGLSLDQITATRGYLTQIAHSDVLSGIDPVTVVLTGSAANALLDEIAEQQADLVVMTSRGRTGFGHWLLGSVARQVARHATVPVLLLREHIPLVGETDATDRPLRVLIPLDGSQRAEAAVQQLGDLLDDLHVSGGAHVYLVYVMNPLELQFAQIEESIALIGANAYLECVAEQIEAAHPKTNITVSWSLVKDDDVASVLIEMAQSGAASTEPDVSKGYDLVAMATHGRAGLARWALGSVTERMFGNIPMPFFIVRSPDITQQQIPDDMREHAAMTAPL